MNVMPIDNPHTAGLPQEGDAHLRDVAKRRWTIQREQKEQLKRRQREAELADRVQRFERLRPARKAARSLSPVYSLFTDSVVRGR